MDNMSATYEGRGRLVIFGAAALIATISACGSSNQPTGSLYVRVLDKSTAPAADVVVTTEPATESLVTDALGSVFFAKVPVAGYAITATHSTAGSGRTTARVLANEVASATITLGGGAGGIAGTGGAAGTGGGGTAGTGGAAGTSGRGGTGGVAGTGVAGRGGTGGSAAGSGGTGGVSATVVLAALTKDSNGVNLSWTSTPGNAFATYRVYRGSSASALAVINILQDGTAVQYRDESGLLGVAYTYRVGGVTAGGQEVLSNTQTITTGVYINVGSQIERMIADPTRPYLYGVDRVNNSLHFINLTTATVEKTIFVGSTPVDLDINLQGTTLYVANFGSTEIATVDLDSRTRTGSILVDTTIGTWDGNPYRLACTAGDTLVFTSMDQWNDLKLVNALTGGSLGGNSTSIYQPDLVASPDGVSVYAGESGISTEVLYRYDIVNGKLMAVDQAAGINAFTAATVLMTRNGMYVFYAGRKFLAKNLKSVLGTFTEAIVAVNGDGSLAISASHIFDGTTFSAKRMTPLSTSTMVVSPDDKTLYLYDGTTSRIYIYGLQ